MVWGYDKASGNECYVFEWTGEDVAAEELPPANREGWEQVSGFDFEILEDGSPDWEEYEKKVNEALNNL